MRRVSNPAVLAVLVLTVPAGCAHEPTAALNTTLEPRAIDHGPIRPELVALEPYPTGADAADPAAYRATLRFAVR